MRFALISLSIYFIFYLVGSASADINDTELFEFESGIDPELYLEFSEPFSNQPRPKDLSDWNDPSNALRCDGYLTNNPSENFCSETVPDDWTPMEFNNEVYYIVPLRSN